VRVAFVARYVSALALAAVLCAGAFAGCGQRLPLPVPPQPPAYPTDQYIVEGQWFGYGGVTDILLTRHSFAQALLLVRDSARVEAYYPGSPSSERELRPTESVVFLADSLVHPVQIAEGPDGDLYVADARAGQSTARVIRFSPDGRTVRGAILDRRDRFGNTIIEWETLDGLAVDDAGNVYVAGLVDSIVRNTVGVPIDTLVEREVRRYAANGSAICVWATKGSADSPSAAARPMGLFADSSGLLVADNGDNVVPSRVVKLSLDTPQTHSAGFGGTEGFIRTVAQPAPGGVTDVTADAEGNVYVADPATGRVLRFDPNGTELLQLVNEPSQLQAGQMPLAAPRSVAASLNRAPGSSLFTSRVYVSDPATDRIVRYAFKP
jgi:predicted small lipoprotein YifL